MASLTPGVLSKLLENSGKATSSHRFPLLQVIEIVPCLADDQWQSEGFFLKVSDSLHAAFVAVSAEDADMIRTDEIQLGQLVYVRGGFHIDKDCPVPLLHGLKPVPKRRPCLGNPSDLVSSDVLVPFITVSGNLSGNKKGKPTKSWFDGSMKNELFKNKEVADLRRLSLDSARRAWDQTPPTRGNAALRSSQRLKPKQVFTDKKASPKKNESPSKLLTSGASPLKNKNGTVSPKSAVKVLKDDAKALSKEVVLDSVAKVPLNSKSWSDQGILWNALPSVIRGLGREVLSHRNVAYLAAARALEMASAADAVIHCLQIFGELCESSQKLSAGQLVQQFLDVRRSMQSATTVIHSLLNLRFSKLISKNHSSSHNQNLISSKMISENASSWVQAAIESNLSKFSLFKEPGKHEIPIGEARYYVTIENFSKELNSKNYPSKSKMSPAGKNVPSPSAKHLSAINKTNYKSKSGLKEAASLAEKLLMVSRQWFLKYLEDSLNKGFSMVKGEGVKQKASLLVQLKRVNQWLDDLAVNGEESEEKIGEMRKKLHQFLLENIESSGAATRHNTY